MNYYDAIKDMLKKGWYIQREYYPKNKVSIYQVVKDNSEKSKLIYCEIASNVVRMLKKELSLTIPSKNVTACNFKPTPVDFNCVRTYIS